MIVDGDVVVVAAVAEHGGGLDDGDRDGLRRRLVRAGHISGRVATRIVGGRRSGSLCDRRAKLCAVLCAIGRVCCGWPWRGSIAIGVGDRGLYAVWCVLLLLLPCIVRHDAHPHREERRGEKGKKETKGGSFVIVRSVPSYTFRTIITLKIYIRKKKWRFL